jgi:hypothetical protein
MIHPSQIAKSGSEASEQKALFAMCALNSGKYPQLRWLFHIPNGGSRDVREGANLKAQGVKPGVPDLALLLPKIDYHGLVIEMKRKGGKVSPEQELWLANLSHNGYSVHVCYSWEQAWAVIENYLNGK